jgi:Zn-dependent M32 family carboxypeptidase
VIDFIAWIVIFGCVTASLFGLGVLMSVIADALSSQHSAVKAALAEQDAKHLRFWLETDIEVLGQVEYVRREMEESAHV